MADAYDILVVIPCLNEEAHLDGLLGQLTRDPGCRNALIVVADGGSRDASRTIAELWSRRDARVRLLDNPDRIQSAGMNRAVRELGREMRYLVRIDAHCRYPEGYVATLIAALDATGAQSVVTPMATEGRTCFQRAVAAAQNSRLGAGGSAHRVGGQSGWIDHGHHAAWRMEAYRSAGGYDETFSHNEDAELDARLAAMGARIWFAADAQIIYLPRSAPWPLFRQYLAYGRGRAMTVARHRMRMKPRQLLPLLVAPSCAALLLSPMLWPLALPAGIWAVACLAYGLALAAKSRDLCVLAAGPAAMIMHLAWSAGFLRQALFGPKPLPFAPKV